VVEIIFPDPISTNIFVWDLREGYSPTPPFTAQTPPEYRFGIPYIYLMQEK
jgi:hypothetical protein